MIKKYIDYIVIAWMLIVAAIHHFEPQAMITFNQFTINAFDVFIIVGCLVVCCLVVISAYSSDANEQRRN